MAVPPKRPRSGGQPWSISEGQHTIALQFAESGRIQMYFGWADPALNPEMGIDDYEQVRQTMEPRRGISSASS